MINCEIKLGNDYAETLITLLSKYRIPYTLKEQNDKIFTISISNTDVDDIFEVLLDDMTSHDVPGGGLNDYRMKIDNLVSIFATLKDKLESPAQRKD